MNYQQARQQTFAFRGRFEHADDSTTLVHAPTATAVLRWRPDGSVWFNPFVCAKALINGHMPLGLVFYTNGRRWICGPNRQPLEIHGPVMISPSGSVEPYGQVPDNNFSS